MKILSVISSALTLVILLTGCSSLPIIRDGGNDMKIAEETFNSIINALDNKDSEALKAMFSEKAKEEAIDLDEGIEYIINFYQGKMISTDGAMNSEENFNSGKKKLTMRGHYTVKTDIDTYIIFYVEKRNTADTDEEGLYMLQVIKESKEYEQFSGKGDLTYGAGVFHPKMLKSENFLESIAWALGNKNSNIIKSLFSPNAIAGALGLEDSIKNANDLFQGHMESSKEIETSVEKDGDNIVTKGYYEVTTKNHFNKPEEAGTYLIYFVHKRNEVDPDEDGLYTLEIAEKVDENTELSRIDKAGIIVS